MTTDIKFRVVRFSKPYELPSKEYVCSYSDLKIALTEQLAGHNRVSALKWYLKVSRPAESDVPFIKQWVLSRTREGNFVPSRAFVAVPDDIDDKTVASLGSCEPTVLCVELEEDRWFWASLAYSVLYCCTSAVQLLIDRGADLTAKNKEVRFTGGLTILHIAATTRYEEIIELLCRSLSSSDLAKAISVQDDDGNTPLHLVAHESPFVPLSRSPEGQIHFSVVPLLMCKENINLKNKAGKTPLTRAIENNCSRSLVKLFIDQGCSVSQSEDGSGPLHSAEANYRLEMVCRLYDAGSDIGAEDSCGGLIGGNALVDAIKNGRVAVVHRQIELGADLTAANKGGQTPLHEAVSVGHNEIIRLLCWSLNPSMMAKALSAQDASGNTPLHRILTCPHFARHHGQYFGPIRHSVVLLLMCKENIDLKNKCGNTPLQEALERTCSSSLVQLFIDQGCSIRHDSHGICPRCSSDYRIISPTSYNKSCIFAAVVANRTNSVKSLIDAGSEIDTLDDDGRWAWVSLKYSVVCVRPDVLGMRDLFQANSNIITNPYAFIKDLESKTPLYYALRHGADEVLCGELICPVNAKDVDNAGDTALHSVAQYLNSEFLIKKLLEYGATIDQTNLRGLTPLHLSVSAGRITNTRLLLHEGADVNQIDTAMFVRRYNDAYDGEALEALLDSGYEVSLETINAIAADTHRRHRRCVLLNNVPVANHLALQ